MQSKISVHSLRPSLSVSAPDKRLNTTCVTIEIVATRPICVDDMPSAAIYTATKGV